MIATVPDQLSLRNPQDWPPLLTVTQVAELLLLNRQTVLAMIDRKELPAVKAGKRWRIAPEDVWPFVPSGIRARWPEGPWRDSTQPS
jgi:excisionase family DNA binding protein